MGKNIAMRVISLPRRLGTILGLLGLVAAACVPAAPGATVGGAGAEEDSVGVSSTQKPRVQLGLRLRDYGPAPELANSVWRNTPGNAPLRLADLGGSVVALDFWTFG